MTGELPPAACGCEGPPRNSAGLPLSPSCGDHRFSGCGGCTGYSGGYDTYMCGCRCHWCPSGLHLRERVTGG